MIGVELRQTGGRSQIVELAMTGEKRRTRHGWESRTGEEVLTGAMVPDARDQRGVRDKLLVDSLIGTWNLEPGT